MSTKKKINILGVTGSVGGSAVDAILAHPDRFEVNIVTAHSNERALGEIAKKLNATTSILTSKSYDKLLDSLQDPVDLTLTAIVGMAGLEPLMRAIPNSMAVAIANKEPLVAAGALVMNMCAQNGTKILPVDSEHNAIFQVFETSQKEAIDKIILTASGGPFYAKTREEMAGMSAAQAVKHPNWSMGAKISVDSATMMNKALEVIEAHHLFQIPPEKIEVLVHPQSIIHSMVAYNDGSVLAQLGAPDMKTPITYALGWPERIASPGERLDFSKVSELTFLPPDFDKFPALRLAYECLRAGRDACHILNTANEVAVAAFLNGEIGFLDIVSMTEQMLAENWDLCENSLEAILAFDKKVREKTKYAILNSNYQKRA